MIAIIFALISFFGWGVGDIPGVIATRKLGAYSAIFWGILFSIIIGAFYTPFVFSDLHNFTTQLLLLNFFLAIIFFIGDIAWSEAFIIGNPALVGTISSSFTALVVLFSLLFLGEKISIGETIAIVIIFAGVLLTSFTVHDLRNNKIFNNKAMLLSFLAMLCWGIYFTFVKIPVKEVGWFWPNYLTFLCLPLLYIYMRIRKIKVMKPTIKGVLPLLVIHISFVRTAEFSFNYAIDKGLSAIVAPIAGANPALFVPLAFLVFREPVSKQQIIGIIIALVGIISLAVLSS